MGTYKGIKGVKVESKASDPSASEAAGQVWYNTSSKALKYAVAGAGSWASGGALNAGRGQMGLTGIITAAVAKSATTVKLVPSHCSVSFVGPGPPG